MAALQEQWEVVSTDGKLLHSENYCLVVPLHIQALRRKDMSHSLREQPCQGKISCRKKARCHNVFHCLQVAILIMMLNVNEVLLTPQNLLKRYLSQVEALSLDAEQADPQLACL